MKQRLQAIQLNWVCCKLAFLSGLMLLSTLMTASSHREAPLISNDPLADNVDVYAFRSPDNPSTITLIATYIPLQLPHGGPNYYNFGENVRYEIHVDNDAAVPGDEVTYRFTFTKMIEDPTTFFNIRLGAQNLIATYLLERSTDGGQTFQAIVTNGVVPPPNIGPRSIESGVGLGSTYEQLFMDAITTATTGEKVFAGPTDDPFFVDLGGVFDLGDLPRQDDQPRDGLACYNVSALVIQVPISTLLKEGAPVEPTSILDPDYVIGVWASASRPAMRTLTAEGDPMHSGDWVQVSRLGMPLTNEVVIPIGDKDYWNRLTPYDEIGETTLDAYFYNPELALYMDDDQFGGAVPALAPLRIQTASLGAFDFTNGADGLFGLKGNAALAGTALDDAVFGTLLLPGAGMPRSVDLWPVFHTGVPNVRPYHLATGKGGDPLAAGKPFVNNFLPNGGDMLRLNMAVPPTSRSDANFSSLGLIQAAAIGLTVAPFNTTTDLEFIPNMDGFPNGRRLEDDVTRIELQAVGGVVLAAIGLWYDDFDPATSTSPVTQDLLDVLTYTTGVEKNDVDFRSSFPYLALPFSGYSECSGDPVESGDDGMMDDRGDDMAACPVPSNIQAVQQTNRTFRVSWDAVDGAAGYIFRVRLQGNTKWFTTGLLTKTGVGIIGPTNRTYEYQVKTVCGTDSESVWSETMTITLVESKALTANGKVKEKFDIDLRKRFSSIRAYPNPAYSSINIDYKAEGSVNIAKVYNLTGSVVTQFEIPQGSVSSKFDISGLTDGAYYMVIESDGKQVFSEQITKLK